MEQQRFQLFSNTPVVQITDQKTGSGTANRSKDGKLSATVVQHTDQKWVVEYHHHPSCTANIKNAGSWVTLVKVQKTDCWDALVIRENRSKISSWITPVVEKLISRWVDGALWSYKKHIKR